MRKSSQKNTMKQRGKCASKKGKDEKKPGKKEKDDGIFGMFKALKKNMQEMMSSPKKEEEKKIEFDTEELDAHLDKKMKDLSKEKMGKRLMPEEQKEHVGDPGEVETVRESTQIPATAEAQVEQVPSTEQPPD